MPQQKLKNKGSVCRKVDKMSRPIKIVRVTHGYNMFVNDVPVVVIAGSRIDFDREKAGVGYSAYAVPNEARPHLFKKKADVLEIALQVGSGLLKLGSNLDDYVEGVGFPPPRK